MSRHQTKKKNKEEVQRSTCHGEWLVRKGEHRQWAP